MLSTLLVITGWIMSIGKQSRGGTSEARGYFLKRAGTLAMQNGYLMNKKSLAVARLF